LSFVSEAMGPWLFGFEFAISGPHDPVPKSLRFVLRRGR
jgi:hypothetical protein